MIWKLNWLCVYYFAWTSILHIIQSQTNPYNVKGKIIASGRNRHSLYHPFQKDLQKGINSNQNHIQANSNSLFIFKSQTPPDVFYPRSYLNGQTVQKPSSNLESKSIPELMSTLKNLIHKRKKTTTQLPKDPISLSTGKSTSLKNVRLTTKPLSVTSTKSKKTVPVLSLFEPSMSLTRRSPQVKTSHKLQFNDKASQLVKAEKIMSDSISKTIAKSQKSNRLEKASHTIIIAQTANIMSHVGSQNNNQKSKTDVKGPVYVESRTTKTNTQNTVNVAESKHTVANQDNNLEAERNMSINVKNQPMRGTKFVETAQKKTNLLQPISSNDALTKGKASSTLSYGKNKTEISKNILRRSLRRHASPTNRISGLKDPTAKAKAIWNSIKRKIEVLERKSKRDTSLTADVGKSNGNFDVLYSLVQMILAFKDYQDRQKQRKIVHMKTPTHPEEKLQISKVTTAIPGNNDPLTKPVRKSYAQSKISSAMDLMASNFNYISEPTKINKIEKNRRVNDNIMKKPEVIGTSLSNSARTFENKIHLQGISNNGLKQAIVSQKKESKVTDFVLDPSMSLLKSQRKTNPTKDIKYQNNLYNPSNQYFSTKNSFSPIYRFSTKSVSRDSHLKIGLSTQPSKTLVNNVWQRTTLPPTFQLSGSTTGKKTIVPLSFKRRSQYPQHMRQLQVTNEVSKNKRNMIGSSLRVSRDHFARTTMQQKPIQNVNMHKVSQNNPNSITFNFSNSRTKGNKKSIPNSVPRFSPSMSMFRLPESAVTSRKKLQNGDVSKPLNTYTFRHDFGMLDKRDRVNATSQNSTFRIKEATSRKPSFTVGKKSSFSYEQAKKEVKASGAIITSRNPIKDISNSSNSVILASINNSKTVNTINSNKSNINQVVISNTNINNAGKTSSSSSGFNAPFVINSSKNVTIIHRKTPDGGDAYHIIQDSGTTTTKPIVTKKPKTETKKPIDIRDFDFEEPIDFLHYFY